MKSNPHWSPDPKELLPVIPPKDLTAERQYCDDSIHPFCPEGDKDTTCPLSDVPKPASAPGTPARHTQPPVDEDVKHPSKCKCTEQGGLIALFVDFETLLHFTPTLLYTHCCYFYFFFLATSPLCL